MTLLRLYYGHPFTPVHLTRFANDDVWPAGVAINDNFEPDGAA